MSKIFPPSSNSQRTRNFQFGAWGLSLAVSLIAFAAWGKDYHWHFLPYNAYTLFPLLGLLAFSIMWSHYISGTLREILGLPAQVAQRYFQYTGYIVLALICLHPGLLIYQRFHDGYGLPPHSYESYVAPGLGWVTVLGSASLLVFLAFELHRFFGKRPWWHFVQEAGDFAMLAIFYHSLRLGGELQGHGWFHAVWLFYGATLVLVLLRSYTKKYYTPSTA